MYVKWVGKVMCIAKKLAFGNCVVYRSWKQNIKEGVFRVVEL